MPRFAILRHEMPTSATRGSHWDFMLECEGVLRTWAIDELPSPGHIVAAQALPDHRLAYLDYEGPVSGDRGSVTRYDRGEYELLEETLQHLRINLHGEILQASVVLTRAAEYRQWSLTIAESSA